MPGMGELKGVELDMKVNISIQAQKRQMVGLEYWTIEPDCPR
jgi:hypothetical protein